MFFAIECGVAGRGVDICYCGDKNIPNFDTYAILAAMVEFGNDVWWRFGAPSILPILWLASDDQKDADFVPYYSHALENEGRHHHPPLLFPLGGHLVNAAATAKWLSWKSWS